MSAKTIKFSLPNTTEVPRHKLNTIILSVKFTLPQYVVNFCCTWLKLRQMKELTENLAANLKALCVYIYVFVCVYIHS